MDSQIEINFESHPPIEADREAIVTLLKQTLLSFVDCSSIADCLIELKNVTQVIASEANDESGDDNEDDSDDNIFGIISYIDLEGQKDLKTYLTDKSPDIKQLSNDKAKVAVIFNERYVNLPPQLSVPTLKNLTEHLDKAKYSHLIFLSKILLRSKDAPNKKRRTDKGQTSNEPIIYLNPEEEIIFEGCKSHQDIDVSSQCDYHDNGYIPNRRIMIVEYANWKTILDNIEKELK